MKIAIITFHRVNNYGAVLQNFALQKALIDKGHVVEVVDYQCDYIYKPWRLINLKNKGFINYFMGIFGHITYKFRTKNMNNFRSQINYTHRITRKELKDICDHFDLFIVGSDQVWNPKLTGGDTTFLLDFIDNKYKKASYAASLGGSEIPEKYFLEYSNLWKEFGYLSIREESAGEFVSKLTHREVPTVVDPTMLLTPKEWIELAKGESERHPYLLMYQLSFSNRMIDYAKALAKKYDLKIICLPFPMGKPMKAKLNFTAGPTEFLALFKNASYILTNSFHGTVFSVLFKKQFYVEVSQGISKVSSRITDFLDMVGLSNHLLSDVSEVAYLESDYDFAHQQIEKQRKISLEYLDNMITDSKKRIILFEKKEECMGCTACSQICPTGAIEMRPDKEGFIYPEINEENCILCNKCIAVCPLTKEIDAEDFSQEYYAAYHKKEDILKDSSSGGVFTVLSDEVLSQQGVVYGVLYDEKFSVVHSRATSPEERNAMRGSKYTESRRNNLFLSVAKDLQNGLFILFSGTPCQCAGLKSYLKMSKIDKSNLLLCDFECHGVFSPLIYEEYKDFLESTFDGILTDFAFREKKKGWRNSQLKVHIDNNDVSEICDDKYSVMNLYRGLTYARPSCFECHFTSYTRASDITMADFWNISETQPDFNNQMGVSRVLVNTQKGKKLFAHIENQMELRKSNKEACWQPHLEYSAVRPNNRDNFWKEYYHHGIAFIMKKYGGGTFLVKIKKNAMPILVKTGLFGLAGKVYNKFFGQKKK